MVLGFRNKKEEVDETVVTPAVSGDESSTHAHNVEAKNVYGDDSSTPARNFEGAEAITTGVDPELAIEQLKKFNKLHRWDLHLPQKQLDIVANVLETGDVEKEVAIEHALLEEDSPYPEVAASVRNYDDVTAPVSTIRMWTIGLVLTTVCCSMNMLFSLRNPSITVTTFVVQLIAYPIGQGWDYIMPKRTFKLFGRSFSFNPSPFNMKEHAVIVAMANASFGGGQAYATDILLAQEKFYGQFFGWGFQMLLVITSQMVGFGLAGLGRRFLVCKFAIILPFSQGLLTPNRACCYGVASDVGQLYFVLYAP